MDARADTMDRCEMFVAQPAEDHCPYLTFKSLQLGKYVSCDNMFYCGQEVRVDRDRVDLWERWELVPQEYPHAMTSLGQNIIRVFKRSRRTACGMDGHPCIKVHPCGWVQSNTFGRAQLWEGIRVHVLPSEHNEQVVIALQAWTGKFFTVHPKRWH